MSYFLYKLIPPRTTFAEDMTAPEQEIMAAHVGYWAELMERRVAIGFGPVGGPSGGYGLAIVESDDPQAVTALGAGDPAVTADAGFRFEVSPWDCVLTR